jgi:hypothetical protein
MTRPRKQTVDYFPHYCNHKSTIFILEQKYGNDGYAFWFKLLEMMGTENGHFIDFRDESKWVFLQAKTKLNAETCQEILDLLSKINAIDPEFWKIHVAWSQNFVDGLAPVYGNRRVEIPSQPSFLHVVIPPLEDNYTQKTVKEVKEVKEVTKGSAERENKRKELGVYSDEFETFYAAYPNKKAKMAAWERWSKMNGVRPNIDAILTAIQSQIEWRANAKKGEFRPEWKHPATWLGNGCWDDEVGDGVIGNNNDQELDMFAMRGK